MKKLLIAAMMLGVGVPTIPAAVAQRDREYREDLRDARRDYRRDVREARRERNWRQYRNYDWNRYENGYSSYDASRYYRDGRYYRPTRVYRNTRIYRGSDNRYYCRRNDGTTGLIIGGAVGGLLGNSLASGRSSTVETLLGAGAGALLGREIDRGRVSCR